MFRTGLVSVTFRSLAPDEIVELARKAGLQSIEWGGDIHVPPGDERRAHAIGERTRQAGLAVAAYGSYYRVGCPEANAAPFDRVLASAVALGAPAIRVWAGNKSSATCPPEERRRTIEDALRIAEAAAEAGLTVALEYHAGTLTDTRASVQSLLAELRHPGLEFLWQPANGEPVESNLDRLRDVLPRVRHIHVFHWWPTAAERHPLSTGEAAWRAYVGLVRQSGRDMSFLLEFLREETAGQLAADAGTLRRLLE